MKNSTIAKFTKPTIAPKPPSSLGPAGKALWQSLMEDFDISDAGGLAHLLAASRAEDDLQRMREQIKKDGDTIKDRFGQAREHPLLSAVCRTETTRRQALVALRLDLEPAKKPQGEI